MVSPLKYMGSDPDGIGRGAGRYYARYGARGKYSKRYRKRIYFAKYTPSRDVGIHAGTKLKKANIRYAHTGDGTYALKGRRAKKFAHSANRQRWV